MPMNARWIPVSSAWHVSSKACQIQPEHPRGRPAAPIPVDGERTHEYWKLVRRKSPKGPGLKICCYVKGTQVCYLHVCPILRKHLRQKPSDRNRSLVLTSIHPRKCRWNPRMEVRVWKMIFLFKVVIFRLHVRSQGSYIII